MHIFMRAFSLLDAAAIACMLGIAGVFYYIIRQVLTLRVTKTGEPGALRPPPQATGDGRYRWEPYMGDVPTRNTTELCPHCRARCEECNDEGKILCQAFGCGGRGFIVHAQKICTALPPDQPHPQDCACKGTRRIVTQSEVCPVCHGTKYAKCALCNGTTEVSTGRDNSGREAARSRGAVGLWQWHAAAPPCTFCRGTGRVQETLNEADKRNLEHAKKIVAEQSRVRL